MCPMPFGESQDASALPCPGARATNAVAELDEDRSQVRQAPPCSASLAQVGNDMLKRAFTAEGWLAIVDMPKECSTLNVHCSVCHQWIANPKHLKTHVQRAHAGLWERQQGKVEQGCRLVAPVLRSPCQYCGRKHRRPDQHSSRCTVIWQACFLQHIWGLRDRPGHDSICRGLNSHSVNVANRMPTGGLRRLITGWLLRPA